MTAFLSILALVISSAGVLYLASTNAKRLRAFNRQVPDARRWALVARIAIFAPGILLITGGFTAAFVIWMGAITVLGWGIAAFSPTKIDRAQAWLENFGAVSAQRTAALQVSARDRLASLTSRIAKGDSDRIAALEARVAELERLLNARNEVEATSATVPAPSTERQSEIATDRPPLMAAGSPS